MKEQTHKHSWSLISVGEFDLEGTPYVVVRFSCTRVDCEEAKFAVAELEEL